MRISSSQIYGKGVLAMERNQSQLVKLQNQISSGRRLQSPADDPVAAAQVLGVTQAQAVTAQYARNQGDASDRLRLVEGQLTSLTDLLQSVRDRVVQAGNTVLSDSDRQAIAAELEARFDEMLGIANSRDAQGEYLFSGYQGGQEPFARSAAATPGSASITYSGDDGQRLLQVTSSQQMATNIPGSDLFLNIRDRDGSASVSAFQTLQKTIDLLRSPLAAGAATVAFSEQLQGQLGNLDQVLGKVSSVTATVGAQLQELDALSANSAALDIQYQQNRSDLEDLDYAKAISDFTMQQVSLEAAQKSFVAISGLSLFKYI